MNENIKKFLDKVAEDKELQVKFAKLRDPEEAYKLAAGVQGGFTKEEFQTEMKKIYDDLTKDLSEDEISKVAGGGATGGCIPIPKGVTYSNTVGTLVDTSQNAAAASISS